MVSTIGEEPGKVWRTLDGNGGLSVVVIPRRAGLPRPLVERAIGWLARENKVVFDKVKNVEVVALR